MKSRKSTLPDKDVLRSIINDPSIATSFSEEQMISLLTTWENHLKTQRMLVDMPDSKILVVGDIHGDLLQMQKAFSLLHTNQVDKVVFDGDIIDRGSEMVECVMLILAEQILRPDKVFYLRGNHEISNINAVYGFRGYSTALYGSRVYRYFSHAFQQLPLAMKIGDWAFITHGGVPKDPIYFHMMRLELKPKEPEIGPYSELLWNDPDKNINGFRPSYRGQNIYRFGQDVFDEFMEFHALDLFVRAHQAYPLGYRWFFDSRLLSLFSSRAGPYSVIDPHYAILNKGNTEIIAAESLEI